MLVVCGYTTVPRYAALFKRYKSFAVGVPPRLLGAVEADEVC